MIDFKQLVIEELAKARRKHSNINSYHEGYAVIQEEVDEFWDEVKCKVVNRKALLSELVQVAAMCQRLAEDCALLGDER